jgi:hypothetical protein
MAVKLSAVHSGRCYPTGNIPGTHFCQRLIRPQGHCATGGIMSVKNSNDTIGNRTRDLPVCCAVSQPTAPRSAPSILPQRRECEAWRTLRCYPFSTVTSSRHFVLWQHLDFRVGLPLLLLRMAGSVSTKFILRILQFWDNVTVCRLRQYRLSHLVSYRVFWRWNY